MHPHDRYWIGLPFGLSLLAAVAALGAGGLGTDGTHAALTVTARVAFPFFWAAYAGGPLTSLFGAFFRPLQARARGFGLAFAAAMQVHVGLILWLCLIGGAPPLFIFEFFGIALIFMYFFVLVSFTDIRARLHPLAAAMLFGGGMNYIDLAFARDFFRLPSTGIRDLLLYLPFAAATAAGAGLWGAAFLSRLLGRASAARAVG